MPYDQPNFKFSEFSCKCGCGTNGTKQALISALQQLRNRLKILGYDKPIRITSGYRCEKHNTEVGGAPNSYHAKGLAADIRCDIPIDLFFNAALSIEAFETGGIGVYLIPGHERLHVDCRGFAVRWYNRGQENVYTSTFEVQRAIELKA